MIEVDLEFWSSHIAAAWGMMNGGLGATMIKRVLVCTAVAAMMTAPALGADIPVKAPAAAAPQPYNWSGLYIGANIGGVWSDPQRFYPNLPEVGIPATTFTSSSTDAIYGAHGGFQWQFGQWVLGVEASYEEALDKMKSSVSVSPPEPFTHLSSTTRITQLFTIGPRVGFAWDRFMVYGTGGYAAARLEGSYSCADTGVAVLPGPGTCGLVFGPSRFQDFGGVTWNNGWFAGGGIEYMAFRTPLTDIILGVEYQHFDVNFKTAFVCSVALCGPTHHQTFLQAATGDIVRARLTFKTPEWVR
jgi:outer membrane immunogenic protein